MDSRASEQPLRSPRNRLMALLLSALAAVQLLAFHALCREQVRRAESRQVATLVQRQSSGECPLPISPSLARPCLPGTDGPDAVPTVSAAWR